MDKNRGFAILKAVAVWTPSILLGLLFTMQGVMKLSSMPAWIQRFEGYGYPAPFLYGVGLAELVGGLALFVPRLASWAGLLLAVVMLGASGTHLVAAEMSNAAFTFGLAVVFFLLARARMSRAWRPGAPAPQRTRPVDQG
jgi:uncharacterized membrane protein YphA (DoxX/SURF4 family)